MVFEAFFLPAQPGERFCVYRSRASASRPPKGIVYVHPFAEEMNKARRMAALQSARLAEAGYAVLQIDLYGCGDSSGDFGEASWENWKTDVKSALAWLAERTAALGLWGLRLGATLAAELAADAALGVQELVLWQPVVSGEQFLTQFLRLRLAAEMMGEGRAASGVAAMRERLSAGEKLEIAGYELAPQLALPISRLELAKLAPRASRVRWLEVSATGATLSAASQRALEAWRRNGVAVDAVQVAGEPFWSTVEIAESPALLDATTQALQA